MLFATYPALVVLGVATTRGPAAIGRRHLVALAGVLLGVALVIGPDASATIRPLGIALALLSAACFAVFVVGAGALSTAFAFLVLFAALPRSEPVTAGVVLGAEPVVTVMLGVVVLGEHVTMVQGIGFALAVGAVAVLAAVTSRRPPVPVM